MALQQMKSTRFKTAIFITIAALLSAQSLMARDNYCFENTGLKSKDTIRFSVAANRITAGAYVRADYANEEKPQRMKFNGTKTGTVLTINIKGKTIYEKPKDADVILWKMTQKSLIIPMHGRNHETGKYSDYDATFEKCQP